MAKKVLSIVLAVVMIASTFAVGSFAATDYKKEVDKVILGEVLYSGTPRPTTDEMLAQFIAEDPDIIERNLYFWKDEVIDEYHDLVNRGVAVTDSAWEDLYIKMGETFLEKQPQFDDYDPAPYDWYWPLYAAPEKATVDLTYSTDVETAQPGDVIEVTLKATTNFWSQLSQFSIFYDKTLVDCVDMDYSFIPDPTWKSDYNAYFGLDEEGNPICYDSWYTSLGYVDQRKEMWPIEWRDNENGEYDQYNIILAQYTPNTALADYNYGVMYDDQVVFKAKFKVKDGVKDGTEISFFGLPGAHRMLEDEDYCDATGVVARAFYQARILGQNNDRVPYEINQISHTYTFHNATVKVGNGATSDPADYTALDAAIDAFSANDAADYTAASWAAYKNAVDAGKAVSRDLLADDQKVVDDATAAIAAAKDGLEKNYVVSAVPAGTATLGTEATVDVVVTGSPEMLRVSGAGTLTFDRDDALITDNGDGTETWKIKIFAAEESADYTVYAKYISYTESGVNFTIKAEAGLDLSIHSIEIPDGYPNSANGDTVYLGKHTVIIKTSTDVTKIQFVDTKGTIADGCTYTYAAFGGGAACDISDDETTGERTWTITHSFNALGSFVMPIRTRSASTLFATTGDTFNATVVY